MIEMEEAVLYYRTSFHEADKILDNGFSQEMVSLFELSDIEEDGNQGDVLLQVKTGLGVEEMEYFLVCRGKNYPPSWSIPSVHLNQFSRVSYMAEFTITE